MNVFKTWQEARDFAVKRANEWNTPQGIEKAHEYGKAYYKVRSLPKPENRFGVDLRCESVEPGSQL